MITTSPKFQRRAAAVLSNGAGPQAIRNIHDYTKASNLRNRLSTKELICD
jgi:hypothetical protein